MKKMIVLLCAVSFVLSTSGWSYGAEGDKPAQGKKESLAKTTAKPPAKTPGKSANVTQTWWTPGPTRRGLDLDIRGGGGFWFGNTTYQIGKKVKYPDGSIEYVNWPLSELEFPHNVAYADVGASFFALDQTLEGFGDLYVSLTEPIGDMKDSDWTDPMAPWSKTVYSESDADLNAWGGDAGLRYWLYNGMNTKNRIHWGAAVGAGYLYQDLDWDIKNTEQWYPAYPNLPHENYSGKTMEYKAQVQMPYLEAAGRFGWRGLGVRVNGGISPYTQVSDEDDHVLRYMNSKNDASGWGWKMGAEFRYDFARGWFVSLTETMMGYKVDGYAKTTIYDGMYQGDNWEIYQEITSWQYQLMLQGGYRF